MKIVLSAVLAMFLVACSDNKEVKENTQTSVKEETKVVEAPKAVEVKEEVVKVEAPQKVEPKPVEPKPEPVKVEEPKVVTTTKTEVSKVVEETKTEVAEVTKKIDGGALFGKCVACHGQNGEKAALGKSQIIKGWSSAKVMEAFHGYKAGTYGGAMKGVMKSQIANFSEEELKALANHISKL